MVSCVDVLACLVCIIVTSPLKVGDMVSCVDVLACLNCIIATSPALAYVVVLRYSMCSMAESHQSW